ncbi:MAG: ATP-binding protein [Ginsengibacter sp.]
MGNPHLSIMHTDISGKELVTTDKLKAQINELKSCLQHKGRSTAGENSRKGYPVLFYGQGKDKSTVAILLGKVAGIDVYRIDLSIVVSKYIGETEKNIASVFKKAENKNWILFFDEADALFGKRTDVRDAHDRYANQEVTYLLQRMEDYNGMVILATNKKNNIDDAFIRRFSYVINFPK